MFSLVLFLTAALGQSQFTDTFDYPNGSDGSPKWDIDSVSWEVRDHAMAFAGAGRGFATLDSAPAAKGGSVEATLTIHERLGKEWAVAGVCLREDARNFWHLALIEAPEAKEKKHMVELTEMLDGVWLAQSNAETKLTPITSEGNGFDWQYDRPYRLRLALNPRQIEGFIFEADGKPCAHLAFKFDNKAVTVGKPALDAGAFAAAFNDVAVNLTEPAESPVASETSFPPYSAPGNPAVTAEPTGFFHPKNIDGRDWLIDPNGKSFYIIGTDHISYYAHFCEKLGYAPYARNIAAKYGSEKKWADTAAARLADWNFNALPANHSLELRHRTFPHIEFLSFGASFSDIDGLCQKTNWTGFPDVFNPKWPLHCDIIARHQCAPVKDDPWLIGYFLDNELEWFGKSYQPWGLFDEAWKKPPTDPAKKAWLGFLKNELKSPAEFEKLWGVNVPDWDTLAANTNPAPPLNDAAAAVAEKWVQRIAEEYFRVCAEALRRHDPHHLVLGCRFAGDAPDVWQAAGKYCDVVSFNIYPRIDVEHGVPQSLIDKIAGWHAKCQKPMMVTEWSFPALDAGLPSAHGAGMRVDTQAQRAKCFTYFQDLVFRLPFMVGSDYFMWADEPALGISTTFPEDSNYGLVNEKDEAYPELTQAAKVINARVYELHANGAVPVGLKRLELADPLSKLPEKDVPVPSGSFKISVGDTSLEGPFDGIAWRVARGDTCIGNCYAMLHEEVGQSLWVNADAARIVAVRQNDAMTVVDMETARTAPGKVLTRVEEKSGQADAQNQAPRRFKAGWRFWIPRNAGSWFGSQCLWVENTDDTPWKLAEVFHYIMPFPKADPNETTPVTGNVPCYYQHGGAWVNTEAKAGIGCWYMNDDEFECSYWKDPGGGFHPDLRQKVDKTLAPGQRLEMPNCMAFFFPLTEPTLAGFGKAVMAVEQAVTKK